MGQKDESKVRAVQFHPNLSYEDFVRGWRPTGEGKLTLADGVFMEAIKAAKKGARSQVRRRHRGDQPRQSGPGVR
jgi:5-methylcytosine-specific restriction protein B